MYKVIGYPRTRTFRVIWTLVELDQPFDWQPELPHSDAVTAVNPSGKVPALIVDGEPIRDSVAIITYLADKHGALTFPAGTIERARQDSLSQFVVDEIEGPLWAASRHSFLLPKERRLPELKETLRWEFARSIGVLEQRLGDGPFLCGETMTIADILLTHCLNWAERARFEVPSDAVRAYWDRVRARAEYQRALEIEAA